MADEDARMPWGMSAGRRVADLGNRYLTWLSRKGDQLKPDWLRKAVANEIRKRQASAKEAMTELALPSVDELLRELGPNYDFTNELLNPVSGRRPAASGPASRRSPGRSF